MRKPLQQWDAPRSRAAGAFADCVHSSGVRSWEGFRIRIIKSQLRAIDASPEWAIPYIH